MTPTSETARNRLANLYSKVQPKTASRASFALLDQAVISGVSFATGILVGRFCSKAEFGVFTLGMSIVLLAISVQQSLISAPHTIFVIRFKGTEKQQYNGSVLAQAIMLNLLLIVAVGVAAIALSTGLGPADGAWVMLTLMVVCPAVLLREFARRFMFAHFRMSGALILDICIAVLQLGLLAFLLISGRLSGLSGLIAVGIACAISGFVWMIRSRTAFKISKSHVVPEIRRSWDFGRWIFGGQVSVALVAVFLNWWLADAKGTEATGAYGACMTLILLANPFILGIQNLLSPNMAKAMHEGGRHQVRQMVLSSSLVLATVMAVYAVVIGLWGEEMVQFIYGDEYVGNQLSIALLGIGAFALALGVSANHGLRAIERPEINFYAAAAGFSLAALVAVFLIPEYGVLGAAIGYLVACTVTAIVRCAGFAFVSGEGRQATA